MLDRNLSLPHELVCATDDARGLDKEIRIAPVETNLISLGNAYPKLAAFRKDAAEIFGGDRLCLIDLDCVIVGKIDSLFQSNSSFLIWRDVLANGNYPAIRFKYNTSLVIMDAGARSIVWEKFDPTRSPMLIKRQSRCGSDQAWVSKMLDDEMTFSSEEGIYSWRFEIKGKQLPENAKIIFFHGMEKPWMLPHVPLIANNWK